jgi:D-glycero-D-manno-heptose 1,7-bisphosphate phosphatase
LTSVVEERATRRPAVFLDRDGVLNEVELRGTSPVPPPSLAEFRILPGVARACERLRDLGYLLVVVTNQPDIARGTQTRAEVDRMHDHLREQVPLDEIVVCPHDDGDDCPCRKPRPGMILDAAARHGVDLTASFCVGDRWRDVEAAHAAGVRAVFVERGYAERRPSEPDAIVTSLPDAVAFIKSHHVQRGITS